MGVGVSGVMKAFLVFGQPHLAVDLLVAKNGRAASLAMPGAAGGGGQRPALIGLAAWRYSAAEVDDWHLQGGFFSGDAWHV